MAAKQAPTLGRIVHYKATQHDIDRMSGPVPRPDEGQVLPAIVVAVPEDDDAGTCSLLVFCDAPQVYSVRDVLPGDEPGQYAWPTKS